jgi:hypothetical protein
MRHYPSALRCVVAAATVLFGSGVVRAADVPRRQIGEVILENVPYIPTALRDRMKQYLNVRTANFLDIDNEGMQVLISTRFGNTDQLHIVTEPGGDLRQITFFD